MGLAHMLNIDRSAVVCDLAETYHIYSMDELPARVLATLACGLKADSRIKTKLAGVKVSPPFVLLGAMVVDELRAMRVGLFGGKEKPVYVTEVMEKGFEQPKVMTFKTGADFEAERRRIIERKKK